MFVLGRGYLLPKLLPHKNRPSSATEIADDPVDRSAPRPAAAAKIKISVTVCVLRLPCAFLRLTCAFHHLAKFRDDGKRWGTFFASLFFS